LQKIKINVEDIVITGLKGLFERERERERAYLKAGGVEGHSGTYLSKG
jgi:hypothetical protein